MIKIRMRILNLNNVADEALFKGYYNVVCSSILPFGQGENIFFPYDDLVYHHIFASLSL